MANPEDATVEYSVKELLATISGQINGIDAKLDSKAAAADLHAAVERISALEQNQIAVSAVASYRRWFYGLAISQLGQMVFIVLARHYKL